MFEGSMVALVTPMTATGAVDERRFIDLLHLHIEAGTKAVVILGTTGEAQTLTETERVRLIELALETVKNRIPIIVGTGAASTLETVHLTEQAFNLGASACLVVTPYYNKPTQEGLYQHYRAIAETVAGPIILYNVPKRTGCDLETETVARLSEFSNIIGIKEATGDLARGRALLAAVQGRLKLYSGDDASALAFMLQGGKGIISVTANVVPKLMQQMCEAALEGDIQRAGALNTKLMPLHKNLFVESNPIPVKWALEQLGWIDNGIRLPLTPLQEHYHADIREALAISEAF